MPQLLWRKEKNEFFSKVQSKAADYDNCHTDVTLIPGFSPTGGWSESQFIILPFRLTIVIHIKDYIKASQPSKKTNLETTTSVDNLVNFSIDNVISKEYIGIFVDKLMKMPDDPHSVPNLGMQDSIDPMEFVASRILADEKW